MQATVPNAAMTSMGAAAPVTSSTGVIRALPAMRTRKNSDDYIYVDSDIYQTAFLNIQLPHGVKLEFEDNVYRQIKR